MPSDFGSVFDAIPGVPEKGRAPRRGLPSREEQIALMAGAKERLEGHARRTLMSYPSSAAYDYARGQADAAALVAELRAEIQRLTEELMAARGL